MNVNKLLMLIKRDLYEGNQQNRYKYLFFMVFLFLLVYIKINVGDFSVKGNKYIMFDLLFEVFKGFTVEEKDVFPIVWMLMNLFLAIFISTYCYEDLHKNGVFILIRVKKISYWWLSKQIWIVQTVILYYLFTILSVFIVCFCFYLFSSGLSFEISLAGFFVKTYYMDFNLMKMFLILILSSITISMIQVSLSLLFTPMYGFLIVLIVLFISVFYSSPWFLGDHLSILKYNNFSDGMLTIQFSILYNLIVILFVSVFTNFYLKSKDIFSYSKGS
ncbi:hypothetical protein PDQ36_30810 [Bacillus cereus]|jgi:hypothetical protein|uniref:hypothetical protein n=1 Tax=Bacillus cereus group TaxID=86661 RepID=UPI00080F67C3|nr:MULTISPECIES: hypothetical protein [Bacillus cereus group]ANV74364.1 hypothetical protein BCM43_28345 [Bacillus thuringiensis]MCU7756930.1 hypothetical protein [Bacillus cereus]MDA2627528.1 hypothetical protein [Bacillus cereus]MDC7752570.1 hypothetical protein [Bacillus cereus]PFD02742.1 hypothetical protein CN295_31680 [Bacillus cereus]